MVKENDTWQFANCRFWFERSSTQARPTHLHIAEILSDSRFLMEGRAPLLLPPTHFSCLRYCPENFLPPGIDLPCARKEKKIISPLPAEHIVPSNILDKKCWQWGACGGRGYRTPACEAASHAGQTSLTPHVAIGQNELWSRILSITLEADGRRGLLPHVTARFFLISHLVSLFERFTSFYKACVVVTWLQFRFFLLLCQRSKRYPSALLFLFPFDSPPSAPNRVRSKCRSVKKKEKALNPLAGKKRRL